jgi:hypothetical protein
VRSRIWARFLAKIFALHIYVCLPRTLYVMPSLPHLSFNRLSEQISRIRSTRSSAFVFSVGNTEVVGDSHLVVDARLPWRKVGRADCEPDVGCMFTVTSSLLRQSKTHFSSPMKKYLAEQPESTSRTSNSQLTDRTKARVLSGSRGRETEHGRSFAQPPFG